MTARVPRQQRGADRRDALLAAAVDVVSEHGPAGFSANQAADVRIERGKRNKKLLTIARWITFRAAKTESTC